MLFFPFFLIFYFLTHWRSSRYCSLNKSAKSATLNGHFSFTKQKLGSNNNQKLNLFCHFYAVQSIHFLTTMTNSRHCSSKNSATLNGTFCFTKKNLSTNREQKFDLILAFLSSLKHLIILLWKAKIDYHAYWRREIQAPMLFNSCFNLLMHWRNSRYCRFDKSVISNGHF